MTNTWSRSCQKRGGKPRSGVRAGKGAGERAGKRTFKKAERAWSVKSKGLETAVVSVPRFFSSKGIKRRVLAASQLHNYGGRFASALIPQRTNAPVCVCGCRWILEYIHGGGGTGTGFQIEGVAASVVSCAPQCNAHRKCVITGPQHRFNNGDGRVGPRPAGRPRVKGWVGGGRCVCACTGGVVWPPR